MKSWTEISVSALRNNVAAIRAAAGDDAQLLAVIKANGYGHGGDLIAPILVDCGLTWLGVADIEEGANIRRALGRHDAHILLMSGIEPADAPAVLQHRLTPVIWTTAQVQALETAAERAGRRPAVHLEIDTGMARQGASPGPQLRRVVDALHRSKWVRMEGVLTHLTSSERRDSSQTVAQLDRLQHALDLLKTEEGDVLLPDFIHIANSSALDEGSTTEWVRRVARAMRANLLVRPGIALYGYCLEIENALEAENGGLLSPSTRELAPQLQPILTWKTRILATRNIAAGQTVGYGATFAPDRPMRLALLPIGYSDGFRREASSATGDDWVRGWVRIAGQPAPVVGRVSMNLTVVDITNIPAAIEGAEVTLLGDGVTAEDHARWCGTISYEILCGIRAHRRLVD